MDESVVKHLEQPQVGVLTLSAAIRIGALIRPQCTGTMFRNGGSCALGAAYEALYGYPGDGGDHLNVERLYKLWERVSFPSFIPAGDVTSSIGTYRNDAGWSRERIADWLEAKGY